MDDKAGLRRCHEQGFCCAQIMVQMGLMLRGEENAQMVRAMAGLCGGVHRRNPCGALSGGMVMLSLFDEKLAAAEWIPELEGWFRDTFGSVDCHTLLEGETSNRRMRCPPLIEKTYGYAKQLLADCGLVAGEQPGAPP